MVEKKVEKTAGVMRPARAMFLSSFTFVWKFGSVIWALTVMSSANGLHDERDYIVSAMAWRLKGYDE
jgi:hypothetical protein